MKKKALTKPTGKRFQIEHNDQLFVGIDVHKKDYHIAVWSEIQQRCIASWVSPACPETVIESLRPHQANVAYVVYEAGPTGFQLARALQEQGFLVDVVSAAHIPRAMAKEEKSDRLDAQELACQAAKDMLHPIYIPDLDEELDRGILRRRKTVVKESRRAKVRIRQLLLFHGITEPEELKHWTRAGREVLREQKMDSRVRIALEGLLRDLEHFENEERIIQKEIREMAKSERYAEKEALLETIPGVGLITAMNFLTEFLRPEQFTRREQVGKMLGLAPRVRSSGMKRKEMGRIRSGKAYLRSILVEAAWKWIAQDEWANAKYRKLMRNTGEKKKAIVGMARKLAIIMWRMLLTGRPYRPLEATV